MHCHNCVFNINNYGFYIRSILINIQEGRLYCKFDLYE